MLEQRYKSIWLEQRAHLGDWPKEFEIILKPTGRCWKDFTQLGKVIRFAFYQLTSTSLPLPLGFLPGPLLLLLP